MALGICSEKIGKGKKKLILPKNYPKIIAGGGLPYGKNKSFPGDYQAQ